MVEYIDRNVAIDAIKSLAELTGDSGREKGLRSAVVVLTKQDAADVEPVRHGRWVWDPDGMDFGLGAWVCSECGCKNDNLPHDKTLHPKMWAGTRYCPNCGAKMGEEEVHKRGVDGKHESGSD